MLKLFLLNLAAVCAARQPAFISLSAQTLLDMVENYPTALRTLILAENNISPELQQQISDLLSEGEEEEETEAREVTAREKNPWICQNSKSSGPGLVGLADGDRDVWGVSSATDLVVGLVPHPCELQSRQPPATTLALSSIGLSPAWKGNLQGQCSKEQKRYLRGVSPDAAGIKSLCKALKPRAGAFKISGAFARHPSQNSCHSSPLPEPPWNRHRSSFSYLCGLNLRGVSQVPQPACAGACNRK